MKDPCLVFSPRALLFAALAPVLASGCSSSSGEPPADGGSPDAVARDGGAEEAAATCNDLVNAAPAIAIEGVASDPPGPEGGTIADGPYGIHTGLVHGVPAGTDDAGPKTLVETFTKQ